MLKKTIEDRINENLDLQSLLTRYKPVYDDSFDDLIAKLDEIDLRSK